MAGRIKWFGEKTINTEAYSCSTMLVSNGEYFEFVQIKAMKDHSFGMKEERLAKVNQS